MGNGEWAMEEGSEGEGMWSGEDSGFMGRPPLLFAREDGGDGVEEGPAVRDLGLQLADGDVGLGVVRDHALRQAHEEVPEALDALLPVAAGREVDHQLQALRAVPGFGAHKTAQYGEAILSIIADYSRSIDLPDVPPPPSTPSLL